MVEACLNGGRVELLDSGPSQMIKFRSFYRQKRENLFPQQYKLSSITMNSKIV